MPDLDLGVITALIALATALGGLLGGLIKGKRNDADIARQAVESARRCGTDMPSWETTAKTMTEARCITY